MSAVLFPPINSTMVSVTGVPGNPLLYVIRQRETWGTTALYYRGIVLRSMHNIAEHHSFCDKYILEPISRSAQRKN